MNEIMQHGAVSADGNYVDAVYAALVEVGAYQDDLDYSDLAQMIADEQASVGLQAEAGVSGAAVVLIVLTHSEPTAVGSIGWWLTVAEGRAFWNVFATGRGYQNTRAMACDSVARRDDILAILRLTAGG